MTEKGSMAKNMTTPMNMTADDMQHEHTMPMNMPSKMANGSMEMIMLQNVTLNILLIQNLTEITNTIIPESINATNRSTTNALAKHN